MDVLNVVIVLVIVALFGLIIFQMIRLEARSRDKKLQISRSLGFTPLEPGPDLVQTLSALYKSLRAEGSLPAGDNFELHNVFQQTLPDGEMYLFDLVETSGEDDSNLENQAVAVISPHLDLPPFLIFPKTDREGALAEAANKVLGWLIAQMGQPVDFSKFPEFQSRYLVSSPDPDATRLFLDEGRIRRLAKTRLLTVHAGGNIFTCSQISELARPLSREILTARVHQAKDLFFMFRS